MTRTTFQRFVLAVGLVLVLAPAAWAVSTRHFSLDDEEQLTAGKLDGTAVTASGSVVPGVATTRMELQGVALAHCLLATKDGTTYVGTGNDGKIYRLAGDSLEPFAETGELMVASLAMDRRGVLYAGTLPKGKIFRIDAKGEAKLFSEPEGAEHVWALVHDAKQGTLFAATGPEGKVFAIDAKGRAEVHYDADAAHVMALVRDTDGTLYAGTSDDALLLRLQGAGRAEVVHDFEGNELTSLALRDGVLAVAANHFPKAPAPKSSSSKTSSNGTKKTSRSKPGKGALWRVDRAGQAVELFQSSQGHITRVQWGDDGEIFAATGKDGHIYRIAADGTHSLWVDVDERQILDMQLTGKQPLFVTGDGAALYRIRDAAKTEKLWTSKVLDAQFRSRWGQLSWRGRGPLRLQTRSGNTEKPDATWTDWSAALGKPGPVRSPAGRFLQIRANLGGDDAELYAVKAYYLPANQNATLSKLQVSPRVTPTSKSSKGNGEHEQPLPKASSVYWLRWKVDNPDEDRLRYRVRFRREGGEVYRDALRETEVLTDPKFYWETDSLADGHYRVQVEASDELDNPNGRELRTRLVSEPVLVDNHAPDVQKLRYAKGKVTGEAVDSLGPIALLEYNLDGHQWQPLHPVDDLFDTARERFEIPLTGLEAGPHVIAVRALDMRHNLGSAELEFRTK